MSDALPTWPRVWLVTGPKGAGKTRWCERVVADACDAGFQVAGVLSRGVFMGGRKMAIMVRDLWGGEERLLARRRLVQGRLGITSPVWDFDEATLEWANGRLAAAGPCHTLVVDELGPLELQEERGWTAVWEVLRKRAFTQALLTARPALVSVLQARIQQLGAFEIQPVSLNGEQATEA